MIGPEHYREAERMLAAHATVAADAKGHLDHLPDLEPEQMQSLLRMGDSLLARAQVHATLALAAATAHDTASAFIGDDHVNAWRFAWVGPPPRCEETDSLGARCSRPDGHPGDHSIPVTS